jgi:hypothetical protein
MRKVFSGLAGLMMLAVVVQFFLAGSGAFDTAPNEEAFRPHRALGYVILLLSVVLTLFAALARMPGRIIGLSGLVVGLTILQPVIALLAKAFGDSGDTTPAGRLVFGLHAVNALIIMAVLRLVHQQSRALTTTAKIDAIEGSPAAGRTAGSTRSAS